MKSLSSVAVITTGLIASATLMPMAARAQDNGANQGSAPAILIIGVGALVAGVPNQAPHAFDDGAAQTTFPASIDPGVSMTMATLTPAHQLSLADGAGADGIRHVSSVPEPSTNAMLCAGLLIVSLMHRATKTCAP